jgi:hypothetical protein
MMTLVPEQLSVHSSLRIETLVMVWESEHYSFFPNLPRIPQLRDLLAHVYVEVTCRTFG